MELALHEVKQEMEGFSYTVYDISKNFFSRLWVYKSSRTLLLTHNEMIYFVHIEKLYWDLYF